MIMRNDLLTSVCTVRTEITGICRAISFWRWKLCRTPRSRICVFFPSPFSICKDGDHVLSSTITSHVSRVGPRNVSHAHLSCSS
uniref:Uncharacterized protein n=1 Tax=Anguilla anguilla TaxID=7936 RepID=A0A0E9X383_ANGAN